MTKGVVPVKAYNSIGGKTASTEVVHKELVVSGRKVMQEIVWAATVLNILG